MSCYNLISVYCPVPYYSLWCKRHNGEKLEFNCLFYTKSFLVHRIFMKLKRRAKEGRLVQPQYHTHHFSSISETAAFLVSISVWEKAPFKSSSSPQLYVFLPLHSLHVIVENQILGVIAERGLEHFLLWRASYLPALLPIVELHLVSMT